MICTYFAISQQAQSVIGVLYDMLYSNNHFIALKYERIRRHLIICSSSVKRSLNDDDIVTLKKCCSNVNTMTSN